MTNEVHGGQETNGILPAHIRVRAAAHRLRDAGITVRVASDAAADSYEMVYSLPGNGQVAAAAKAIRSVERVFPGASLTGSVPPKDDLDTHWRISFSFFRSCDQAAWDGHLFDAISTIFEAATLKEEDKLGFVDGGFTRRIDHAAATLGVALDMTGDPVFGIGRNLLLILVRQTPGGCKRVAREDKPYSVSGGGANEIARKTFVSAVDMLDRGHEMGWRRPGRPVGHDQRRLYNRLWWTRNAMLVGLAMKDDGSIVAAGEGLSKDIAMAIGHLRELSDFGGSVMREARDALAAVLAETPRGMARTPIHAAARFTTNEIEDRLLAGADAILDVLEQHFPPYSPIREFEPERLHRLG